MDPLKTLQEFIVVWIDEIWWSMRDRVGALSIIESLENSWKAAGRKVGEISKGEGTDIVKTVEAAHAMLGRTVKVNKDTVLVTACPFWDRILAGNLEYGLRCEEFFCAPFLIGIKEALDAKEATVKTNLRLAYITRAKLEYKLVNLKASGSSDSKIRKQIDQLEEQLAQLSKEPACIFLVK